VLVVGAGPDARRLVDEVVHTPRLPFEVVGVVADRRRGGLAPRWPLERLPHAVERSAPQLVVVADEDCRARALDRLIEVGHLDFAAVDLPEFYEYVFGRLPVSSISSEWFMSILHLYRRPYSQFAKRAFDVLLAGLALLLVAPLLPLIALVVRRTPGPVVYRQTRLGEGGRPFTIYKFRTMRQDAEKRGAVWAAVDDPRVTPAGRFLRASRLDELPQLWNVLRGDMSIVGPRPERPEFVSRLRSEVPFFLRRHIVKPGITGWAQIHRGYTADTAGTGDKLSYDLWYLRHRSLVVDLAICMRTATTLLTRSGAR
jgi:exopolysaccharide biosynthesis polyprenyl glycosylphosphotransferase